MTAAADPLALDAYDFALPIEQIAQFAAEPRHAARLLHCRRDGQLRDLRVLDLPSALLQQFGQPPLLVVNDTRVVPARLRLTKPSGGAVELLLEQPFGAAGDRLIGQPCLYKSSKALKVGTLLQGENGATALVRQVDAGGRAVVDLGGFASLAELLHAAGHVPLPPYIRGGADVPQIDRQRYQCTFAAHAGAVAAPTAGLHFSAELLQTLQDAGIALGKVTLHVGPGTFLPVRSADLRGHRVQSERFAIAPETAEMLQQARRNGQPVVAVGTTTTRVLEHAAQLHADWQPCAGWADLTILPGHRFLAIQGMMTNFHLPKSSLLVLVSAFFGRENVLRAYQHAVAAGYRFYSYGDACLFS